MDDFLRFFNEKKDYFPMHMEIYYSKIMDWCIDIYKKDAPLIILMQSIERMML